MKVSPITNLILNDLILNDSPAQVSDQQTVRIVLYVLSAIFIAVAVISFIFSFIFYRKKKTRNQDLSAMFSKTRSWWLKYRAYGFFCLGVLFTLLAIGGIVTVESVVNSLKV